MSLVLENANMLVFIETIEVFELKVGTNIWLSGNMNTYMYEYQRSRSLFDLCPRSLRFKFSDFYSQAAGHQIQSSCGVYLIGQNLLKWCRSHAQDGRHDYTDWQKKRYNQNQSCCIQAVISGNYVEINETKITRGTMFWRNLKLCAAVPSNWGKQKPKFDVTDATFEFEFQEDLDTLKD